MKLYVLRHGLTKCNIEKKYNGRYDEDIIEKGINQANFIFKKYQRTECF